MQTEERSPINCLEDCPADNYTNPDGKSLAIPSFSSSEPLLPAKGAKRPTRQWAAWTREEEESFFTALRQVGKNFEKITCRVQSKNKDQVRHYYYRLVRRMNKLLGPGLCLDAKNSKDTNAAMLRWWSLLEKYSCKASKLHLKPRRFKLFVEALEHQLLKDRKKTVKKRFSQGENSSSPSPTSIIHQSKSSGMDTQAAKVVIDNQNVQKTGNGKGSFTRRYSKLGVSRNINKGESFPKSARQRRKNGAVSAAVIKRWEKAAMAGVSLVADAAEHVERVAVDKQADMCGGLTVLSIQAVGCGMEQNDPGPSGQIQRNATEKLKLQLFPIDDSTRKALEMDQHNPHLELTLSSRKKISSVLEHLGRKWGSSSVASGQLMLFSFDIQRENFLGYQKWKQDSTVTAAEVYALIGKPPVFRLRYGWVNSTDLQSAPVEAPREVSSGGQKCESEGKQGPGDPTPLRGEEEEENHVSHSLSHQPAGNNSSSVELNTSVASGEAYIKANVENNGDSVGSAYLTASIILERNECGDGSISSRNENVVDRGIRKSQVSSAGEWADSLTNVSVGDLLNDVPDDMDGNCIETSFYRDSSCLEEVPFTCDSFDAAIAAHISSQSKTGLSGYSTNLSSIYDAEETCDEFSFQKRAIGTKRARYRAMTATSDVSEGIANTTLLGIRTNDQDAQQEAMAEDSIEDIIKECPSEHHETESSVKDLSILTDMYWPDSLGPLELDVPSCKYYSEDLLLSDSLSGLNRLIANSLDAFQNSPFFTLDDKGMSPATEAKDGASFAGKIGRGDNTAVPSVQV